MTNRPRKTPELWPLALMSMLAAMMGTGTAFYRIAERNPDAVIADAYQASLHYGDAVRAAERARALGWQLELNTELRADGAHATAITFGGHSVGHSEEKALAHPLSELQLFFIARSEIKVKL